MTLRLSCLSLMFGSRILGRLISSVFCCCVTSPNDCLHQTLPARRRLRDYPVTPSACLCSSCSFRIRSIRSEWPPPPDRPGDDSDGVSLMQPAARLCPGSVD